jgi:hypothetical protein
MQLLHLGLCAHTYTNMQCLHACLLLAQVRSSYRDRFGIGRYRSSGLLNQLSARGLKGASRGGVAHTMACNAHASAVRHNMATSSETCSDLTSSLSQSVVKQILGAAPIFTRCGRATLTPVLEYLVTEPPLFISAELCL